MDGHSPTIARWNEPDVLVIGAGAAGAALSWRLGEAGLRVVCLEQGDWVDPATLPAYGSDWELRRLTDFHPSPNVRQLPYDYPVNDAESTFSPLMYNAVGGSTIHWNAHFPRLHPSDFRVRSLDGVGDDWPITYHELEPYYDLNDRMLGISGLHGDPAQPPRSPRQTPPLPLGRLGETMARGFERLGWHWWPTDAAIISKPYDQRRPCNLCGPCDLGCPVGARSSTDVTYWPRAIALGVELRTRCRVRQITVGPSGKARGVIYYDAAGTLREQQAPVIVLACNGIGTARVLLNSRSRLFPDGLANRSGLVGKNLMFHPFAAVAGIFRDDLESYKGPNGSVIFSHEFYESDPGRGFVRGYALQVLRQAGPVGTALGGFTGHRIPWGSAHHQIFRQRFPRMVNLAVMGEDLPEPTNEVALDNKLTDSHGIPAPRIRYQLSENSVRMLAHGVARAEEALRAAGATDILATNPLRTSRGHLLGTCRMGDDPERSVVDRWGRTHDVPNLFVVDGSVFVTAGGVAPTSTIMALALRTADYLRRERRAPVGSQRQETS